MRILFIDDDEHNNPWLDNAKEIGEVYFYETAQEAVKCDAQIDIIIADVSACSTERDMYARAMRMVIDRHPGATVYLVTAMSGFGIAGQVAQELSLDCGLQVLSGDRDDAVDYAREMRLKNE